MNKRRRFEQVSASLVDVLNDDMIGAVVIAAPWCDLNALVRSCSAFASAAKRVRHNIIEAHAMVLTTHDSPYTRTRCQLPNAWPCACEIKWVGDATGWLISVHVVYKAGVPHNWIIMENSTAVYGGAWGSDRAFAGWDIDRSYVIEYAIDDGGVVRDVARTVLYFNADAACDAEVSTATTITEVRTAVRATSETRSEWYNQYIAPTICTREESNLALRKLLSNYDYVAKHIATCAL